MHPTETEKAQPICRVVPSRGYLPMFDVYYGEHRLSAHSTEKAAKLEAAKLNDFQRKVLAAHSIPDPASAVPALVGALEAQLALQGKIFAYLNSYAKGEHMSQWSRVEPMEVLAQVYGDLAAEHGGLRAALALAQGGKR